MLKSGFAEQLVEADVLLFIEPEGVFITRSSKLLCVFSVGTARCFLAKTKIRGERFFVRTLKSLRYGLQGRVCSRCNITTVRAPKQTLGADWSGLERTSEPRYFSRLYLAA